MQRLSEGLKTRWWTTFAPVFVSAALIGCGGETPSAPPAESVGAPVLAAAASQLSVSPRRIHLRCNQGFDCNQQVVVTSSSPVTLTYFLNGDFILNFGATSCPQGGTLAGSCTIGVQVGTTEFPGRRSGTLTVQESTFGTSKTVRLAARVS